MRHKAETQYAVSNTRLLVSYYGPPRDQVTENLVTSECDSASRNGGGEEQRYIVTREPFLLSFTRAYALIGEGRKKPSMYMVSAYMEHDLSGLLENPSVHFSEPQIKCYMLQLLEGIRYLHEVRKSNMC